MRLYGKKTLVNGLRYIRTRLSRHGIVLGYHRIADDHQDPFSICISPGNFEKHLAYLAKKANVISLPELVEYAVVGEIPPKSVAITFDDGYVDNLHEAKPLLDEYQIPATFFIATGYMGQEFWWDEVSRIVHSAEIVDERVAAITGNRFSLGTAQSPGAHERDRLTHDIYGYLIQLNAEDRDECLAEMRQWRGVDNGHGNGWRAMRRSEVKRLADAGYSIGAHTVSHPMLATLDYQSQYEEIHNSKSDLETLIGRGISCFSYPNGSMNDMTLQIVREVGFSAACASYKDSVWRQSNVLKLPRLWPPNVGQDRFNSWIRPWL